MTSGESNWDAGGEIVGGSLALTVSVSGAFIQSCETGTVGNLWTRYLAFKRQLDRKRSVEEQLNKLKNPHWLMSFSRRVGQANFKRAILEHHEKLRAELAAILGKLEPARRALEECQPGLAGCIEAEQVQLFPPKCLPDDLPPRSSNPVRRRRISLIRQCRGLSHLAICRKLDQAFSSEAAPPPELPRRWVTDFGVKTFVEGYRDPKCRKRVQRLISGGLRP